MYESARSAGEKNIPQIPQIIAETKVSFPQIIAEKNICESARSAGEIRHHEDCGRDRF